MQIKEQIKTNLKEAMKNKDEILSREVKKRKDSITQFEGAGRSELAEKEKKEIDVIMKYMPTQMTKEEIESLVQGAIAESGAKTEKDFGTVMKILSPKTKGRADGKEVSEIVKKLLSQSGGCGC